MAKNPKWIRRFNRVPCNRTEHPAFNRLLRFLWHFRRMNGIWLGDVMAGNLNR